jgi:predicted GIY-YIG superfamily endonuclease
MYTKEDSRKEAIMYFIYALTDPRTDKIGYIGITKNLKQRFNQHVNSQGSNSEKDSWIQQLLYDGLIPSIRVLETVENEDIAYKREAYWIQYYIRLGEQLTNVSRHKMKVRSRAYFRGPEYTISAEETAEELNIRGRLVVNPNDNDLYWG